MLFAQGDLNDVCFQLAMPTTLESLIFAIASSKNIFLKFRVRGTQSRANIYSSGALTPNVSTSIWIQCTCVKPILFTGVSEKISSVR